MKEVSQYYLGYNFLYMIGEVCMDFIKINLSKGSLCLLMFLGLILSPAFAFAGNSSRDEIKDEFKGCMKEARVARDKNMARECQQARKDATQELRQAKKSAKGDFRACMKEARAARDNQMVTECKRNRGGLNNADDGDDMRHEGRGNDRDDMGREDRGDDRDDMRQDDNDPSMMLEGGMMNGGHDPAMMGEGYVDPADLAAKGCPPTPACETYQYCLKGQCIDN